MALSCKIYQARLLASLRTLPSARGWAFCGLVSAATLALMMLIGFTTGFYTLQPAEPGLPLRLLVVFFVPALGEEIPFRGLLTPGPEETQRPKLEIAVSTALYTLWHVVEAVTFLKSAASVFLRPDFLLCCAVLGLGCAVMKRRTGSVWPAVILHWALVVIWQTWLGGVRALGG
ncbi:MULTISPECIES: type II CAAX prenyl endopeptidase Rce1 family protein [unclassified Caulobacter]|uniref:CPBP family glutamic-type intramembrane protease n=1 Tax=unclassified Caulobacter TaxID=2648921 RepID=UPI0006F45CC0|nr:MULTISPECIES: CPBP family glutamic-type intramembrane protease [unclassified Caulobacter]KQV55758.1 peptidase [Caulobacter sp. Root342]KQV71069.1 peptidase [Caulobacter sp. Root343]